MRKSAPRAGGGAVGTAFRTLVPDTVRPRVTAAYRPLLYRGDRVECPCCGGRFDRFMVHRGQPGVRCPRCGAMERHRLLWLYLRDRTDLLTAPHRLLHMAPEWAFVQLLGDRPGLSYFSGDLDSGLAGEHFDITSIPHRDGAFDVILCNHVLEHIPDDRAAMRELHRVLAPGGWGILMSPVARGLERTDEDPAVVDPAERLRRFGQEDHVRLYGADYVGRLESAGFSVTVDRPLDDIPEAEVRRLGLRRTHPLFEEDVVYRVDRLG